MSNLRSNWYIAIAASFFSMACSGESGGSGKDPLNPNGYPSCGSDPTSQPSPCIDDAGATRCKVSTGFGGDELALCEPGADDGMLIHIGPNDYSDPAQIQAYSMNPGDEEEFCLRVNTTNTEAKWLK